MGKAPAVILIARHGARLDAEDKTWLETSPTPYDPPLSYGGWTQTRALGGRIASILHERDIALNEPDVAPRRRGSEDIGLKSPSSGQNQSSNAVPKRRKHRVIIHTSPFLRCIQSSIAISAGMAQYQGNLVKFESKAESARNPKRLFTPPSRSHTIDSTAFDSKFGTSSDSLKLDTSSSKSPLPPPPQADFMKPTLRIDSCLGEWLSSDYFEFITAPPSSNMMVAGAKADLMRRGTPLRGASISDYNYPEPPPLDLNDKSVASSMSQLTLVEEQEPSSNQEATQNGSAIANVDAQEPVQRIPNSRHKSISRGYVPPTPNYAISTTQSIPRGYVAHARDSCIKIDYQWDSERYPQEWGDGGEHGEEWSSMHKRFRKGLMSMITWYKMSGPYYDPQAESKESIPEDGMDDDEDIILIIVTHGAGCNALIGALTNQPVLMDVGMGSLTMAVHKGLSSSQSSDFPTKTSPTSRRASSVDCSQSEDYEMRLVASMDHLRAGGDPLKIPLLSPRVLASIPESNKRQGSSTSGSSAYSGTMEPERSKNASLGSVRRSRATTTGGGRTSMNEYLVSAPAQVGGLWGSRQFSLGSDQIMSLAEASEPSEGVTANEDQTAGNAPGSPDVRSTPSATTTPQRTPSQRGLWGGGTRKQPTRRWTVVEQT